MLTHSVVLFLLHEAFVCYYFIFIWRTSFSPSWRVDLLATNCFTFLSSENVFISFSFLKDNFAQYRILNWQLFFFQYLKNVPCPLVSDFRWEIHCYSNQCSPIHNVSFSSSWFQVFFFVFSFQKLNYDVLAWLSFGFSYCGFLSFLNL